MSKGASPPRNRAGVVGQVGVGGTVVPERKGWIEGISFRGARAEGLITKRGAVQRLEGRGPVPGIGGGAAAIPHSAPGIGPEDVIIKKLMPNWAS